MLTSVMTSVNELTNGKEVEDKEDQKKVEEIFEKRGIGKPKGVSLKEHGRKNKNHILKWSSLERLKTPWQKL